MNRFQPRRASFFMQSGRIPTQFVSRIACLFIVASLALSAKPAISAPPPRLSPASILREWATASQAIVPTGKSAGIRTQHAQRSRHNGHQIALIVEFRGPVDADKLLARYRFIEAKRTGNTIRLTAVPRDVVERLFIPSWEITINAKNYLPASLAFFGKNQKAQPQSVVLLSRSQRQAIAAAAHSVEALVPAVIQVAGADSAQPVIFQAVGVQVAEQSMPSLIGLPWKDVRIALPRAGYAVRLIFGPPAPNAKQVGRVYEQFPSPVICSSRGQRSLSEFTKRQASHGFHESSKSLDEKLIAVAGIIGIRSVEKQSNRMNAVTTSLCNGPSTS